MNYTPPHFLVRFTPGSHNDKVGGNSVPILGYKQWDDAACGFASVAMVLSYFRPEVDLEKLYTELGTNENGTTQSAIVNTLRAYGLSVVINKKCDVEAIASAIDKNKVLIIYDNVNEHWMVTYGYQKNGLVLVADPGPCDEYKYPWYPDGPFDSFALVISEKSRKNVKSSK